MSDTIEVDNPWERVWSITVSKPEKIKGLQIAEMLHVLETEYEEYHDENILIHAQQEEEDEYHREYALYVPSKQRVKVMQVIDKVLHW